MPATAGRVKMPENNRLSVSSTLKTHAIWKDCVGYDPYAPKHGARESAAADESAAAREAVARSAAALFAFARARGKIALNIPGACRTCGEVGHLTYQCRNMIQIDDSTRRAAQEATQEEVDEKKLCEDLGIAWDGGEEPSDTEENEAAKSTTASEPAAAVSQPCDSKSTRPTSVSSRVRKARKMKKDRRTRQRNSRKVKPTKENRHGLQKLRARDDAKPLCAGTRPLILPDPHKSWQGITAY